MGNTPQQPADPPDEGASPRPGKAPDGGRNGIPAHQAEHDATGGPTDARHDTETAPSRIESDQGG